MIVAMSTVLTAPQRMHRSRTHGAGVGLKVRPVVLGLVVPWLVLPQAAAAPASDPVARRVDTRVTVSDPRPAPGDPFELEVRLSWPGEPSAYRIHPPRLRLPSGVETGEITASTTVQQGQTSIRYRLELTAAEPGSYALDPVELSWTPREGAEPVVRLARGPTVSVGAAQTFQGLFSPLSGTVLAWTPWLLLLLPALTLVRRRRRGDAKPRPEKPWLHLERRLEEARRLRSDGRRAEAIELLIEIYGELDDPGTGNPTDSTPLLPADRLTEIRYSGNPPPLAELEALEHRVARELAERQAAGETGWRLRTRKSHPHDAARLRHRAAET